MARLSFAPLSASPARTFQYFLLVCGYIMVFVLARELVWRFEQRRWLAIGPIVAIGAVEAVLGLWQYFGGTLEQGPGQEPEAHSDSHREKHAGKIDPSRGRADAGGTRAGGRDDPRDLRGIVDVGGWLPGAGDGGIFHDIGGCSTADPDHSEDRDRTPPGREESDTRADERL